MSEMMAAGIYRGRASGDAVHDASFWWVVLSAVDVA